MKSLFEEYTDTKVCGAYLKSKLLKVAEECDDEEETADFYKLAEDIDENKQYLERTTRKYFEGESD